MQPDERVRREPVPAGAVPPVDQRDADVGVVDQRVRERHPGRARADHEVVGFDQAGHRTRNHRRWTSPSTGPRLSLVCRLAHLPFVPRLGRRTMTDHSPSRPGGLTRRTLAGAAVGALGATGRRDQHRLGVRRGAVPRRRPARPDPAPQHPGDLRRRPRRRRPQRATARRTSARPTSTSSPPPACASPQGYSAGAVCSPTRIALYTGRHPGGSPAACRSPSAPDAGRRHPARAPDARLAAARRRATPPTWSASGTAASCRGSRR